MSVTPANYCRNCGIESPHEDLPVRKKHHKKPTGLIDAIEILEGKVWAMAMEIKAMKKKRSEG